MSFEDWHSGTVSSGSQRQDGFISMSTVDDLSYTPSIEERMRDAAQILATGRRSWKTLKGKGEAVWPPHLEAALLEALEKYNPDDSHSPKTQGRFPLRNRFISDYIFEATGKRRTAKQVGSRLQQLRDTCKGKEILDLISRRHHSPADSDSQGTSSPAVSESSRTTSATPPPSSWSHARSSGPASQSQPTLLWVSIILDRPSWTSSPPVVHVVRNAKPIPHTIHLSTSALSPHDSDQILSSVDPTIKFASSIALDPHCSFSVFLDDDNLSIHTEVAELKCQSSPLNSSGWIYSATLVPGFWDVLRKCVSPTRYRILQNVTPLRRGLSDSIIPSRQTFPDESGPGFSIIYSFVLPEPVFPVHHHLQDSEYSSSMSGFHSSPLVNSQYAGEYCQSNAFSSGVNAVGADYPQNSTSFHLDPINAPQLEDISIPSIYHGYGMTSSNNNTTTTISKYARHKPASTTSAAQSYPDWDTQAHSPNSWVVDHPAQPRHASSSYPSLYPYI